jgi:hypothetical protein
MEFMHVHLQRPDVHNALQNALLPGKLHMHHALTTTPRYMPRSAGFGAGQSPYPRSGGEVCTCVQPHFAALNPHDDTVKRVDLVHFGRPCPAFLRHRLQLQGNCHVTMAYPDHIEVGMVQQWA